jgi:hypothetical protein
MSCDILLVLVEGLWVSFSKLQWCVYCGFHRRPRHVFVRLIVIPARMLSTSHSHLRRPTPVFTASRPPSLSTICAALTGVFLFTFANLLLNLSGFRLDVQFTENGASIRCHVYVLILEALWLFTGTRCPSTLSSSRMKLASSARVVLQCPR